MQLRAVSTRGGSYKILQASRSDSCKLNTGSRRYPHNDGDDDVNAASWVVSSQAETKLRP
jgi:hypothetical protein